MEEIKTGEYVRTKSGGIYKLSYFNEQENRWICVEKYDWYPVYGSEIVKHSFNIIDLIEVGDYVNGKCVFATDNRINDNGEKVILTENYDEWTDDGVVSNKDIKSIVTKEMMKSVEYEV